MSPARRFIDLFAAGRQAAVAVGLGAAHNAACDTEKKVTAKVQTGNRLLDDLAKVASGAASAVVGIKEELDALVRQRLERLVADLDLVTRDEFEAVKAVAANSRVEQEKLEQRLAELEAKLAQAGEKPSPPADPPASDG
jgi:hypothetical protein